MTNSNILIYQTDYGELEEDMVYAKFAHTTKYGAIENKTQVSKKNKQKMNSPKLKKILSNNLLIQ